MLGEVTHQQVSPRPRDARPADVLGGELLRQALEQPSQAVERLEHLGVARGVCTPARHLVTSVLAVCARRPEELATLRQRVADGVLQSRGFLSGQFVFDVVDSQYDRFTVSLYRCGALVIREERDQETGYSVACFSLPSPA